MKTLILYHSYDKGPCPDGIWAAWVAKRKYPDALLQPAIYGQDVDIAGAEHIIIVDFSYPESVLKQWMSEGRQVTLIDHHKTALENLGDLMSTVLGDNRIIFDMQESGATLTWRTFFPEEPMPVVLKYVKDRDIWEHKLFNTEIINAALSVINKSFDTMTALADINGPTLQEVLSPLGELILNHKEKKVAALADRAVFSTVAGYDNIPLVVLEDDEILYTSDVCAVLYKKYPDALFSACVDKEGKKYSLRSNKDGNNTDVGAIARQFGGGGHRNASGCTIN